MKIKTVDEEKQCAISSTCARVLMNNPIKTSQKNCNKMEGACENEQLLVMEQYYGDSIERITL